jgi:hypothetical protein
MHSASGGQQVMNIRLSMGDSYTSTSFRSDLLAQAKEVLAISGFATTSHEQHPDYFVISIGKADDQSWLPIKEALLKLPHWAFVGSDCDKCGVPRRAVKRSSYGVTEVWACTTKGCEGTSFDVRAGQSSVLTFNQFVGACTLETTKARGIELSIENIKTVAREAAKQSDFSKFKKRMTFSPNMNSFEMNLAANLFLIDREDLLGEALSPDEVRQVSKLIVIARSYGMGKDKLLAQVQDKILDLLMKRAREFKEMAKQSFSDIGYVCTPDYPIGNTSMVTYEEVGIGVTNTHAMQKMNFEGTTTGRSSYKEPHISAPPKQLKPSPQEELLAVADEAFRFYAGMNLQDHSVSDQREHTAMINKLKQALIRAKGGKQE